MKPWRDILALCVSIVMMLAVASCSGHSDRPGLVALDSLILQDPDSACELLAAYPADSLPTADDRAYHALLTTIADYKAYRPATTDSVINIAVNHYDHNGANQDKRMRSLLYKGCVKEELGDPEAAIEYYKRAENVCPTTDYFYIGYINLRMASLYQHAYTDSIPINIYKKALFSFQKSGNKHFEAQTLNSLGETFIINKHDSADVYLKEGLNLALANCDSACVFDACNSLSNSYYYKDNYNAVIDILHSTLSSYLGYATNRSTNDIIAISFAKNNMIDSAHWYFNHALPPINVDDSISMYQAKAEICLAEGNTTEFLYYNKEAVDLADSLLILNSAAQLRAAELRFEKAETQVSYLAKQKSQLLFIAILVVAILSITYVVVLLRQKLRFAHQEINDAIIQLNNMKSLIEQQTIENKKYILRIQEQEAQLQQAQSIPPSPENSLQPLSELIIIQEKTKFCIDEILHCVFYNGKHKSDSIIGNDAPIIVSDDFWKNLDEIIAIKHRDIKERLDNKNLSLSNIEKRVFALCSINMPNAIIRRILNYKNVQIVSNYRHKLAVKILGEGHSLEEII